MLGEDEGECGGVDDDDECGGVEVEVENMKGRGMMKWGFEWCCLEFGGVGSAAIEAGMGEEKDRFDFVCYASKLVQRRIQEAQDVELGVNRFCTIGKSRNGICCWLNSHTKVRWNLEKKVLVFDGVTPYGISVSCYTECVLEEMSLVASMAHEYGK